jgi:uncharacterized protein YjbJ (UPF0337 family)
VVVPTLLADNGCIPDDHLKAEGQRDRAVGNVEETVDQVRHRAEQVIGKVRNAVKR